MARKELPPAGARTLILSEKLIRNVIFILGRSILTLKHGFSYRLTPTDVGRVLVWSLALLMRRIGA